jgi:hypothetical protein
MTPYIMKRSFAEFMGVTWPRDVACIINGERITYSQIRKARIERQAQQLAQIQRRNSDGPIRKPAHLWVFFNPGVLYGGWHLYLRTSKHSWWLRRPEGIALDIMSEFPCGVLPLPENFYQWKKSFAATYAADKNGRKQGIVLGWVDCEREGGNPTRFLAKTETLGRSL